jgi:tRNA-dihydrouridine synthase B
MISCKTLIHQPKFSFKRYVEKDPEEGPVCFQLSGNNPQELAEAVKIATDYGADLIDLNCGCPVKKIRSKGAGSSLLTHTSLLYALICAMKKNTHVPVSIKIRVESHTERFNQEVAKVVSEAGTDFLVVHGRHWTEHYETPCRHDAIQYFVEQLNIPVIGNGDIACIDSLHKMLATGCAGVMLARATVGQPWLIQQLIAQSQQTSFVLPSPQQIGSLFIQHMQALAILLNSEPMALLQARKLAKYYARSLVNQSKFIQGVQACDQLSALIKLSEHYFTS